MALTIKYTLREVTPSDWDFWRYLHLATQRDTIERQFGRADEIFQDAIARRTFDDKTGEQRIVVVDGWDAGFWDIKLRPESLFINQLLLLPKIQNMGIGSSLIRRLQRRAKSEAKSITLQTLLENTAKTLYEKLGFVVTHNDDVFW